MANVEMLQVRQSGKGLHKIAQNSEGLAELVMILEELVNAVRGIRDIEPVAAEKPPAALVALAENQARLIARCHHLASDLRRDLL
jgi:hypothetical protein